MKSVLLISLVALLIALALPLLLAPRTAAPPVTAAPASPSAPPDSAPAADGEITFTVLSGGQVRTVTMAEWLPGVLAGEMPALFEKEALKAQAVAARTFILSRKHTGCAAHPDADVCDNPDCCKAHLTEDELREKWGDGYDACMAKMTAAVRDTDGQYLSFGGQAIQALFHSSSAGKTESSDALWGALPYLVSVASPETAEDVPNYVTTAEVTVTNFAGTLRAAGYAPDLSGTPDTWVGELTPDLSGRVATARIGGVDVTGAELRTLFSLRSTAFTLTYTDGAFLFTVTGYGHGVGMSQYGANVMAEEGTDYTAILAHYYPGTELMG